VKKENITLKELFDYDEIKLKLLIEKYIYKKKELEVL
jgi:hypothetical protein